MRHDAHRRYSFRLQQSENVAQLALDDLGDVDACLVAQCLNDDGLLRSDLGDIAGVMLVQERLNGFDVAIEALDA